MTDAQMLQNLLAVYETITVFDLSRFKHGAWVDELKEVIAELRRRIAMEEQT